MFTAEPPGKPPMPCYLHLFLSSPPSYRRKAKPGHKDPRGHSGGFLRPQQRSSRIIGKQVHDLSKATWGCSHRAQRKKVAPHPRAHPPCSELQRSVLETKRRVIVFSLLPSEKLDSGILTDCQAQNNTGKRWHD